MQFNKEGQSFKNGDKVILEIKDNKNEEFAYWNDIEMRKFQGLRATVVHFDCVVKGINIYAVDIPGQPDVWYWDSRYMQLLEDEYDLDEDEFLKVLSGA